jgi:hypothetical protein
VIVDEDPFAHIEMSQERKESMNHTSSMYQARASLVPGTRVPSDAELHNYMISLEVLGVNEAADIIAIR